VTLGAHLFGLLNVSQVGLELVANHLFSQCNIHLEAFYRLRIQDVQALILFGALFPPSVAPVSQQDFGIMELMLSASVP
jgi:hypothetical protein